MRSSLPRLYDRALFAVAAAWNLGAAATLLFQPDFLLARLGVTEGAARLLARSLASSAATWGVAYALLALDARRFRILAWLGALSKTLFGLVYAAAFLAGQISFPAFLPGLVDLSFALLFAEHLWRSRSS